jgi:WD40 repeat protein
LAGFAAPVKSVAFSLDNAHVASGTANNLVLVHDVKTGAVEQVFAEHAGAVEAIAAAGENGKLFITSGAEKSIRAFPLAFEKQIAGHTGPITSVAIVPPQSAKFVSGSDDGTVRVWDLAAGIRPRHSLGAGRSLRSLSRPTACGMRRRRPATWPNCGTRRTISRSPR